MTIGEHFYFAYGSNMNSQRVKRRGLDFTSVFAGTLKGYYLSFNKRSVVHLGAASANIMKQSQDSHRNDFVEGVLYHLADECQIELMDPYEGYPLRYDRIMVDVQTQEGVKSVWTYTANKAYLQEGLKPNTWYLEHLLAGKSYLSDEYYQRLRNTLCLPNSEVEPS